MRATRFLQFTNGPLICIIDRQEVELCTRKSFIIGQLLPNMITKTNDGKVGDRFLNACKPVTIICNM